MGACTPAVHQRGHMVDPDDLAAIAPGKTTREDVAARLGTPSAVSTFDDKTWYYIGQVTEQVSFLDPEIRQQKVVRVVFDDRGVVQDVQTLGAEAARPVSPVDRQTPTYGRDMNVLEQLLGNIGRPSLPSNTR